MWQVIVALALFGMKGASFRLHYQAKMAHTGGK